VTPRFARQRRTTSLLACIGSSVHAISCHLASRDKSTQDETQEFRPTLPLRIARSRGEETFLLNSSSAKTRADIGLAILDWSLDLRERVPCSYSQKRKRWISRYRKSLLQGESDGSHDTESRTRLFQHVSNTSSDSPRLLHAKFPSQVT
jgi:hypothetical protein